MEAGIVDGSVDEESPQYTVWLVFAAAVAVTLYLFQPALLNMMEQWERDEYSHGYMIPMVAVYLIWQKLNDFPAACRSGGSWLGLPMVLLGLLALLIGDLSAMFTVQQYGFLLVFYGLVVSCFGLRATALIWGGLIYLLFMVPLPSFVFKALSSELQLISSTIGVAVVRLFDISVYLEGNVIDLGAMQLQVVEACSGLRYLFPLMSFGFLIAYLYRGPVWLRWLLFLSTVPITVLMNSIRIGLIGVTVEYWGIEMAEGFIHDFEGWVIFMACLGVLLFEIWLFERFVTAKGSLIDRINVDLPEIQVGLSDFSLPPRGSRALLVSAVLVLVSVAMFSSFADREELKPERSEFRNFPLRIEDWVGRELPLAETPQRTAAMLESLSLTDYFKADYRGLDGDPVNLWIAYYDSQHKGSAIHSPKTCIPGGGWEIDVLQEKTFSDVIHVGGAPLKVNRLVIKKGEAMSVVYYWFEGRGRNATDEFEGKWNVFKDSLLRQRTDGALVRFVTMAFDEQGLIAADNRLEQAVRDFYPLIDDYVPAELTK